MHGVIEPSSFRFMNVPRPAMEKDLKAEEKELSEDIKNLEKKVCQFILAVVSIHDC